MEFGKVKPEYLDEIDFTLKKPTILKSNSESGSIHIGCTSWVRPEWVEIVYPEYIRANEYLNYYSDAFNAIELNATYYNVPAINRIIKWKEKVNSDNFLFCPKVSKLFSHEKRLQNCDDQWKIFSENIKAFEEYLGPTFLQLPPDFGTREAVIFKNFIENISNELNFFVEFRNPSWFKPNIIERTAAFLNKQNIGLVITDTTGRRDAAHMQIAANKTMIRFVGNGLHRSDFDRIDIWVNHIHEWIYKGINITFFVHQSNEVKAALLTSYMIKELKKLGDYSYLTDPLLPNSKIFI